MKFAVVGLGAVGSFLAVRLRQRGRVVLGVRGTPPGAIQVGDETRPASDFDIRRTDEESSAADGPIADGPIADGPIAGGLGAVPPVDRIFVATKAYDLASALRSASRVFPAPRHWVLVGNGLDLEEIAEEIDPESAVTRVTVSYGLQRESSGLTRVTGDGVCTVAEDPELARELAASGLEVRDSGDPFVSRWTKGALNCGINPVASLAALTNGDLIESPAFSVAVRAAEECAELAGRIAGRDLVPLAETWRSELESLCRRTAANRCSMLRDLDLGRPTEIDHLNGYVARRAREIGHPAPTNDMLARLVRARQSSSSSAPNFPNRR